LRIRTIKPEFFEDETIGSLSRDARLLVIGTFLLADDEGLLRWSPPYIRSNLFMYDDDLKETRVSHLMAEVVDAEIVVPYIGGKTQAPMAWVVKFRVHQRINRPQPGKLPPPSLQNPQILMAYCRRDDWTCGICGEPISPAPTDWTTKTRPSLDHIVPRSKGGADYPTNIRVAHFTCNASRGARDAAYVVSDYVRGSVNDSLREGKGREQGKEGKGLEAAPPSVDNNPNQPTHDQLYLGERLALSVPQIVKLNRDHGRAIVEDCMRYVHGFPPEDGIENTYAYVHTLVTLRKAESA
jgi:hypothetical protein